MLSIRFQELTGAPAPLMYHIYFRFFRDGEPHNLVRVDVSTYLMMGVPNLEAVRSRLESTAQSGELQDDDATAEHVAQALFALSLRQIEALAIDGLVPEAYTDQPLSVTLAEEHLPALLSAIFKKECRYQVGEPDADLFCAAAGHADETVVGTSGLHRLAPTSKAICRACGVPDAASACSHLSHAEVLGMRTMGGWSRTFAGALCELGRPEVDAAPGRCRPEGHTCWERSVQVTHSAPRVSLSPLAVAEAVDFLDSVWRAQFGDRLVKNPATTHVAGLSMPVHDRDDFKARLSDLAGVVESFTIPDDLLAGDLPAEYRKGSINRLQGALDHASVAYSDNTLRRLRSVIALRAAMQHPGKAAKELPSLFEGLGLTYPPPSWERAWSVVQSEVVEAISEFRNGVRQIEQESE